MGMSTRKRKLDSVRENVRAVLGVFPATRNDDRVLHAVYLKEFHGVTTLDEYAYDKDLPALETIRRRRQEIQEAGEFLPTDPDVVDKRRRPLIYTNPAYDYRRAA